MQSFKSSFISFPKFALFALSVFLLSCEKETPKISGKDLPKKPLILMKNVAPEVQTLEICGQEDPFSIALSSDDTLSLNFNLRALNGMSQYKIDIHSNFDCHAHGRLAKTTGTPWQVLKIVDVEGTDIEITEKLPVPDDVQVGNYHFMLQGIDLKGNEAEWVLYSLKVNNGSDEQSPELEFSEPTSDSIAISKTEKVEAKLNITDNKAIFGGRIDVTYLSPSGTEFTAEQYFFPKDGGKELDYDFSFAFPTTPSTGSYTFVFEAFDAVGNETERRLKVYVLD